MLRTRKNFGWRVLAGAVFLLSCGPTVEPDFTLEIIGKGPRVDPRFLSLTVDTSKVVSPTGTGHYDFARPRLRRMVQPLVPAMLRVGGTEADMVFYDLSETPVSEPPAGFNRVLTREIWDEICSFTRDLDIDLMFTLNAGPGPRDSHKRWLPDNARELISYAVESGCPPTVWELGNEINGFFPAFGFYMSGTQYAEDIEVARALVDELHPAGLLAGPASAYWPLWGEMIPIMSAFAEKSGEKVDVITWHYYPQQSSSCPVASRLAETETLLVPDHLDEIHRWAEEVEQAAAGAPVWLAETSHAQCGGEPGLSDRFVTGFWWLDQLGLIAQRGHPLVMRQAITGGSYSLAEHETLEPKPDYFTSVLWQRLMGEQVLRLGAGAPETLRTYAHCGPKGGITFVVINLDGEAGITLDFEAKLGATREVYRLSANDLLSPTIALNGEILQVKEDGGLPTLAPSVEKKAVHFGPHTYGYVHLPEATCP